MNIFTKAAKGASDFLAVVRASGAPAKVITCCGDTQPTKDKDGIPQGGLPQGFFITKWPDGRKTLGYNDKLISYHWQIAEEFIHPNTKKLVKLTVPRSSLPIFKLSLRYTQADGMARIGQHLVFDTEKQPGEWDGNVGYERYGGARAEQLQDDLSNGLWGGGVR